MVGLHSHELRRSKFVDTICHKWSSPKNAGRILLLVEGPTDKTLYENFVNDQVRIESGSGCETLKVYYDEIQAIPIRKIKYKLFILDSDFSRLNHTCICRTNVFYTDCHDSEMMCLRDLSIFQKSLNSLCIERVSASDTYNDITNGLKMYSILKWFSCTNDLKLAFSKYKIGNKSNEELFDIKKIICDVRSVTDECRDFNDDDAIQFCNEKLKMKDLPETELVNGHDFLKRFPIYLKAHHERTIGEKKFQKKLHENFTMDCFLKTGIYQSLKDWQENVGVNIFKS